MFPSAYSFVAFPQRIHLFVRKMNAIADILNRINLIKIKWFFFVFKFYSAHTSQILTLNEFTESRFCLILMFTSLNNR